MSKALLIPAVAMALVAMFTILLFLLKSPIQTLIIMSLIPMGVIGAVLGHAIIGIPVSILSFLGIVALAGIIINDSVVLVDRYNKMIARGTEVGEALYESAMSRFAPRSSFFFLANSDFADGSSNRRRAFFQ